MEKDIFENNSNPFTVPDGYFDSLQERIMNRIQAEESQRKPFARIIKMTPFRTLVAAAACIILIFTGASLFVKYADKQQLVLAQTTVDEDFYQWFYASDMTTLLAESLDITMPESFAEDELYYSEEDEAIIQFLERDNISFSAIIYSMNN